MYKPFSFENLDVYTGQYAPNTMKYNSTAFEFWLRAFFQRAQSAIILNVIEEWDDDALDILYYWLFRFGYVGTFELDEFGFIFQKGCAYGQDIYYRPNKFRFANPNVKKAPSLDIGKNCCILKLTPDYLGVWDIISYFATKMANLDNALNMSIVNLKLADILIARNKACAETLKKIMDKVNQGEPTVVVDSILLNDKTDKTEPIMRFEKTNLKNSYITDLQLKDMASLISMFDAEIGIPTLPYQKAERFVTDEANGKNADASSRAQIWVETLNRGFKSIEKVFGSKYKMSAKLRFKGGFENVNDDDNVDRRGNESQSA